MKNILKTGLFLVFIGVVVYILKFSPMNYYLFDETGRGVFNEKFSAYMEAVGLWGPFIFIGCYALSILLFIPASVFTSLGGFIFGNWLGLLLNVTGALIGGALSFVMARYFLGNFAKKILSKKHFKKLDNTVESHGFTIILYLRLMFVPFTYLSFAAGLSKIKFRDFFAGTLCGVVPGILVVTFLAAAVKELLLTYEKFTDVFRPDIIGPLLLFVFSFFIPPVIKHFKSKFYVTGEIEKETGAE